MENDPLFSSRENPGNAENNSDEVSQNIFLYPPKPEQENKKGNVWVRSLISLALYLLIGYYFFSANWILLLILTAIVIFHEFGHFLAMKMYHYKELGIFFIPLLGAYASGTKREVSQKQSAIILLALDGGQLLNRLFLDESKIIGKTFVILSALALGYFAIAIQFYPLLVFPAMMLFRLRTDSKFDELTRKVEESGINLEKTYEEISDEDYWKIRNILIENNYATLRNINPAPPYEYSANEDRVVSAIENLLQRTIVQDLSWAGKLLIILIWVGSFAAPFLLNMDLPFLHYQAR